MVNIYIYPPTPAICRGSASEKKWFCGALWLLSVCLCLCLPLLWLSLFLLLWLLLLLLLFLFLLLSLLLLFFFLLLLFVVLVVVDLFLLVVLDLVFVLVYGCCCCCCCCSSCCCCCCCCSPPPFPTLRPPKLICWSPGTHQRPGSPYPRRPRPQKARADPLRTSLGQKRNTHIHFQHKNRSPLNLSSYVPGP